MSEGASQGQKKVKDHRIVSPVEERGMVLYYSTGEV